VFAYPDFSLPDTASQIGLRSGEKMTVHDLLIALLLPSADDAAEALAENVGHGSVDRFIAMMNSRAVSLDLAQTHYTTPIGLDTPGNYSSAWDLVRLARYLLRTHPFFRRVVGLSSAVLRSGAARRDVINRNDLVGRYSWVNGVKTGHTLDAGYVLVGSGTRNGMTLISVVLGTSSESSRDANALALLDYGFHNFQTRTPVSVGQAVATTTVRGWPKRHAQLVAAGSFRHVFARSQHVRTVVEAPPVLVGPRATGEQVGSVVVLADGKEVARVPLALTAAIPAPPPPMSWRTFTLIGIALLLAAGTVLVAWQLQRTRAGRATEKRTAA
jgi:D-alanyl-D-alanine carboxypeptidase (penicillin-binding protein 5/6)